MKNIFALTEYLRYLSKAKGAQSIHSPFVFELYNKVICDPGDYYEFSPIEQLRQRLLHSNEIIEVDDFGASGNNTSRKKVSDTVQLSAIPSKQGRLLFRLVNFLQPRNIIELGTSLGISTLYQHKARPEAECITLEGSPGLSAFAGTNFRVLKATSINRIVGRFDETLPEVIKGLSFVDYVFFDGNHRKEATLEYFYKFLPFASFRCVFVFDDIRWSRGMQEAWQQIVKDPNTKATIDLFSFGLVFFNPSQEKEHFVLKY